MEPGDLDVVGTALRRYMLAQGMAPSGEIDTEEGSEPLFSEEDGELEGEDGEPYDKETGAYEDDPPRKQPKMYSSDENKQTHPGRENDVRNDAEREEPETFEDDFEGGEREEEDVNEERGRPDRVFVYSRGLQLIHW